MPSSPKNRSTETRHTPTVRMTGLVKEKNRRMIERYASEHIEKYLSLPCWGPRRTTINQFDVRAVAIKQGWRNSNNGFHYLHENPETHYYSETAVDEFIEKVFSDTEYLERARKICSSSANART